MLVRRPSVGDTQRPQSADHPSLRRTRPLLLRFAVSVSSEGETSWGTDDGVLDVVVGIIGGIVGIAGAVTAVIAIVIARNANKIAKKGNRIAHTANDTSANALQEAKKANRIAADAAVIIARRIRADTMQVASKNDGADGDTERRWASSPAT